MYFAMHSASLPTPGRTSDYAGYWRCSPTILKYLADTFGSCKVLPKSIKRLPVKAAHHLVVEYDGAIPAIDPWLLHAESMLFAPLIRVASFLVAMHEGPDGHSHK